MEDPYDVLFSSDQEFDGFGGSLRNFPVAQQKPPASIASAPAALNLQPKSAGGSSPLPTEDGNASAEDGVIESPDPSNNQSSSRGALGVKPVELGGCPPIPKSFALPVPAKKGRFPPTAELASYINGLFEAGLLPLRVWQCLKEESPLPDLACLQVPVIDPRLPTYVSALKQSGLIVRSKAFVILLSQNC